MFCKDEYSLNLKIPILVSGAYGFQEGSLNVENIPIFQTDTHLYVKRTTVLDVIRKAIDIPSDKKNTAQLLFEAICKDKSVDLIFTERLRTQMHSYASTMKSKFKLNDVVDWSFTVMASEFLKQEDFQNMYGKSKRDDVQENASVELGLASLPKTGMCYLDICLFAFFFRYAYLLSLVGSNYFAIYGRKQHI